MRDAAARRPRVHTVDGARGTRGVLPLLARSYSLLAFSDASLCAGSVPSVWSWSGGALWAVNSFIHHSMGLGVLPCMSHAHIPPPPSTVPHRARRTAACPARERARRLCLSLTLSCVSACSYLQYTVREYSCTTRSHDISAILYRTAVCLWYTMVS